MPLVLAGVLWAVRAPLLAAAGGWLACGAPLQPVDYLLIMPGDENTRPFAAAALIRAGYADGVLIPRNVDQPVVLDGIALPTHEIIQRLLTLRGVSDEQIIVLEHRLSESSWDDLQALAGFLDGHPQTTIGVITNDYHVRRTRWVVQRVVGRSQQVLVFGVPADTFGPSDWWHKPAGFRQYLGEFIKIGVYWVMYDPVFLWIAIVTAIGLIVMVVIRRRAVTGLRMMANG